MAIELEHAQPREVRRRRHQARGVVTAHVAVQRQLAQLR